MRVKIISCQTVGEEIGRLLATPEFAGTLPLPCQPVKPAFQELPFGLHNTLNLLRGLTLLAFPVAAAAGVFLATRPRWTVAVTAACAAWALGAATLTVPDACHRAPVDVAGIGALDVDRCTFRWRVRISR